MENKKPQMPEDEAKSNQRDQSADKNTTGGASEEEFMGTPIENPAEQSEAGPDIYDIGMGGPGASSSGLRDRDDEDESEEN
jgi:hypothetical protein